MKLCATVIAASLATSAAFTAPSPKSASTARKMADVPMEREKSIALPWIERPEALDGKYAGDFGFDPLGFAKNSEDLRLYREAEIKHARLAMLAAVGWPVSEVLDKKIAAYLDLQPVLDASDRVPSVLNGGMGKISPVYWAGIVIAAAAIDIIQIEKSKRNPNYTPGNLNFDPLKLYPTDKEGQDRMKLAEIKHGRIAMLAVAAYAFNEAVFQSGIIDESWLSPIKNVYM